MSNSSEIKRTVFRRAKAVLSLVSDDPLALNKMVRPVAKLLARLPGNAGRYWEQVEIYMAKDKYSKIALEEFEECVSRLRPGSICIDLGANVGIITEKLAASGATVHAFEPDPWTFERLHEAVGHLPNVILHNAAVANYRGSIQFFRPKVFADTPGSASVASTTLAKCDGSQGEAIEVDCINFVEFVKGLEQNVELVKMDIEGAEVEILEAIFVSDIKAQIDIIFVETHYNIFPEQTILISELRHKYANASRPRVNFDWP